MREAWGAEEADVGATLGDIGIMKSDVMHVQGIKGYGAPFTVCAASLQAVQDVGLHVCLENARQVPHTCQCWPLA